VTFFAIRVVTALFVLVVSGSSIAHSAQVHGPGAKYQPSLFGGVNATQLIVTDQLERFTSDGYNGFSLGVGLTVMPKPFYAIEADIAYTNRVFGFGSSKGFFNTWQIPLSVQLRLGPLSFGGGGYASVWRASGKMEQDGTKLTVSSSSIGNASFEFGWLAMVSLKREVRRVPIRFEFRRYGSISDVLKDTKLKGTLQEYQFLAGYDLIFKPKTTTTAF
jgi:hypothetical protein